jgi:hypothetical protein
MNTLILGNDDLELFEEDIADSQTITACWYKKQQRPRLGCQLLSIWPGHFSLKLMVNGKWSTIVIKTTDIKVIRYHLYLYLSDSIQEINQAGELNDQIESSFNEVFNHINGWFNEQQKTLIWLKKNNC